jgi:hypothetical protein
VELVRLSAVDATLRPCVALIIDATEDVLMFSPA